MTISKTDTSAQMSRTIAALYLKAVEVGEVRVTLPSEAAARRFRMQLYTFNKAQRRLKELATTRGDVLPPSERMLEAMAAVKFRLEGAILVVERWQTAQSVGNLLDAIGGAAEVERLAAGALPGEREMLTSLGRIEGAIQGVEEGASGVGEAADAPAPDPYGLRRSRGG